MIHGSLCCFPIDHEQDRHENFKLGLSIAGIKHEATPCASLSSSIELKNIHSVERMTGASLGHSSNRWILSTHMKNCDGIRCKCHGVCDAFLRDDSQSSLKDLVTKHLPIIENDLHPPFLFVLSQGNEMIEIKSLSSFVQPTVRPLGPGNYAIRDCSVWPARLPSCHHGSGQAPNSPSNQISSVGNDVVIEGAVREWIDTQRMPEQKFAATFNNMHLHQTHNVENCSEDALNKRGSGKKRARDECSVKTGQATAGAISKALHAAHFGVKYMDTDRGAALTLLRLPGYAKTSELHTTVLGAPLPGKPKKVKQPVSAYNFYSMEQRADKKKFAALSNNGSNAEVGLMWKNLSEQERAPYKQLAEEDQLRYSRECDEQSIPEGGARGKGETGYNLFVVQEKCFTAGLCIANLKVRNGQHCSYRWSTMSDEEKRLYELNASYKNKKMLQV